MNKRVILALVIALALILGAFGVEKTRALGIIPFGGQIQFVTYCCHGAVLLQVGPPRGGRYLFEFSHSKLYAYWQIYRTGAWVLGNASPGGVCETIHSECDAAIPADGIINIVGTSR